MELVDTMILIEKCKNKNYTPVFFCEMSLFEMLKNKNDEQRFKTFKDLDVFVNRSRSEMLVSDTDINVFDTRDIMDRYNDALNICNKCAYIVSNSFLFFCTMILQLVLLQKAFKSLQEVDKSKFEKTMSVIVEVTKRISKNMKKELIDYAFNNSSETLEEELYKKILNIFISKINENMGIDYLSLNEISAFTTNGIAKANNIKFQKDLVDKYIDDIVSFNSNEEITKKVYKVYLNDLLSVSGKVCFNDIVDMNIFFAGYTNKLTIRSNDKKSNRLLATLLNKI
ncbi:MAG: hypothetical protein IAC58_04640 [Firmicutes bacterium]|uniref:Uncharacterized protein n=1 Tax=Candidatus Onthovivens merdipullorum TaxID=2840889 RepID=A0A9D9GWP9_9BACL|nr:hypothetical protein [Candidatus Onthovivens merdipullorum]